MASDSNTRPLSIALVVFGAIFTFGIYPLTIVWPAGWNWGPGGEHYLRMIIGVYATLGIFLMMAARNPLANLSLIWFTVWSSVVHAGIMTYQALNDSTRHGHLMGDVAALFLVAIVLGVLTPKGQGATQA